MSYNPRNEEFACFDFPNLPLGCRCKLVDYDGSIGLLTTMSSENNSNDSIVLLFKNLPGYLHPVGGTSSPLTVYL